MQRLFIFDVSPMVYAGDTGMKVDRFGYPVGGIHYVLNRLAVAIASRDDVVLCFDSPSFRRTVKGGSSYKSGREKRAEVYSQIETLYEGLQMCGFRCEKHKGFEADDIVEWAVADNWKQYVEVRIYTNDYDLCHSIRDNTILCSVNSSMNDITPNSYERGIKKGKRIAYNTISAYKVFHGCESDKIPAFKSESGYSAQDLYESFLGVLNQSNGPADRSLSCNPSVLMSVCEQANIFSSSELEDLRNRIKLIYPAEKPAGLWIDPVSCTEIDREELAKFCSLYGAERALQCMKLKFKGLTENDKTMLRNKGKMLNSGEYAVDRDLAVHELGVGISTLRLDSFEKEY